jgi:hypothetical protein
MYSERLYVFSEMCSNQLQLYSHMYSKYLLQIFIIILRVPQIFTPIFHYILQEFTLPFKLHSCRMSYGMLDALKILWI